LAAFVDDVVVQKGRGVDELDRCSQMDVELPAVGGKPRRRLWPLRPSALAAGLDQMRRHLGYARRVLGHHPRPDQRIHRAQILAEKFAETVVRFLRRFVEAHRSVVMLDKRRRLPLHLEV